METISELKEKKINQLSVTVVVLAMAYIFCVTKFSFDTADITFAFFRHSDQ